MTRMLLPFLRILPLILLAWAPSLRAAPVACGIGMAGTTQRIAIGATGRTMLLHRPVQVDPDRPVPLLFLFHGSGGNGAAMLKRSGLEETADRHDFIVAAPDGGIAQGAGFVWAAGSNASPTVCRAARRASSGRSAWRRSPRIWGCSPRSIGHP